VWLISVAFVDNIASIYIKIVAN